MIVALLTDFGDSHYVGQMKGVILSNNDAASIVDITHSVPFHSVVSGAWRLLQSYKEFPAGTIFLAVVDPGVGTGRKALAVKSRNYFFVGPDNGLLFSAAKEDGIIESVSLDCEKIDKETGKRRISNTFHGRDIFARAAAIISRTGNILRVGKKNVGMIKLDVLPKKKSGLIVDIDSFGNVTTNILPPGKRKKIKFLIKQREIELKFVKTFADLERNELGALTGSAGTLEIVANQAPASQILKANIGMKLALR
ncbi:hypothetical protein D6764_02430 [Candidatus Woesearchaeota archaeon]|nr:MAG: hypothetical protein D6764_02430 [Candidatus Woesearchaeota archaeon]